MKKKLGPNKDTVTILEGQLTGSRLKVKELQKRLDHSRSVVITLTKQLEELNACKKNVPFFDENKKWWKIW